MRKKTILAGSIALLFIVASVLPITAQTTQRTDSLLQESMLLDTFMDRVEQIASESTSIQEFFEHLKDLCSSEDYAAHPMVQDFLQKILNFILKNQDSRIADNVLENLLDKFSLKSHPDYLVLSYGAYDRLNPRKGNSIDHFKERLSMWRYTDTSKLLKGRTLIIGRQPFGIHQKMVGPQIGFMKGFKGIYIDYESKITGKSYVFFMGQAHRIRAFDLTPFSK